MFSLCSSCQKVYSLSTNDLQRLVNNEEVEECSKLQDVKLSEGTKLLSELNNRGGDSLEESNCSKDEEEMKDWIDPKDLPQTVSGVLVVENEVNYELKPSTSKDAIHLEVKTKSVNPTVFERSSSSEHSSCVTPVSKRAKFSDTQDLPSSVSASDKTCTLCLGLLERTFLEKVTVCVVDELDQAQYSGLETFSLAIHAALSLLIRQKGIVLFAQTVNPPDQAYPDEQFVKEELREILKLSLSRRLPQLKFTVDSPFQIVIKLTHEQSDLDCKLLKEMKADSFPRPQRRRRRRLPESTSITNVSVARALEGITVEDFIKNKSLLSAVDKQCEVKVEFLHSSLYVAGRYNKYSRHLPQTPWIVEGVKKAETSVEELISPELVSLTRATGEKFSASGREDVDVRMLGSGRPFVLELLNPHNIVVTEKELFEASERINKSTELVAVRQLKMITKQSLCLIKEGETEKRKHYCAIIWVENDITPDDLKTITSMKELKIAQKTPIRVLHRRTLATRVRTIYTMEAKFIDAHHFKLYLCTQAGTYIKEFVHGDFGRTVPNLGTILKKHVDILTLDVEDVELVWPPS